MGAQSSVLQNYELDQALPITNEADEVEDQELEDVEKKAATATATATLEKPEWVLYPAKHTNGTLASVFFYEYGPGSTNLELADNAAKYSKVLRHPGVPRFLSLVRSATGCMLLTERLTPLGRVLDRLGAVEVCAGLHAILATLVFLHDTAGLTHNNIRPSSVFVAADGSWRLGSLEFVSLQRRPTAADKASAVNSNICEDGYAKDAHAFGVLAEYLLGYMDSLGDLTKTFELRIQDEFLNVDPTQRPCLRSLLDDRLFRNDFLEILHFLKNVTMKSTEEKEMFFSTLTQRLFRLPVGVLARRLVRPLLARFVLLEPSAVQNVIPHLLQPAPGEERQETFVEDAINPLLPETLFRVHVLPEVFKIFHVRDVHIRSVLLRHFHVYVDMFEVQTLRSFIFPQILLGLRDDSDALVALTLHALGALVPRLGGDTVIGARRSRLFRLSTPKVSGGAPAKLVSPAADQTPTPNGPSSTANGPSSSRTVCQDATSERRLSEHRRRTEKMEERKEERRVRRESRSAAQRAVKEEKDAEVSAAGTAAAAGATEAAGSQNDGEGAGSSESDEVSWGEGVEDAAPAASRATDCGPPVTVDWSDVATAATRSAVEQQQHKGALQLRGAAERKAEPEAESKAESKARPKLDVGAASRDQSAAAQRSPPSAKPHSPGAEPAKPRPLGAEFDVMAIDVVAKSGGSDDPVATMFAQMQPDIKAATSLLGMLAADAPGVAKGAAKGGAKGGVFDMVDLADTDIGWGDDLNWASVDDP